MEICARCGTAIEEGEIYWGALTKDGPGKPLCFDCYEEIILLPGGYYE